MRGIKPFKLSLLTRPFSYGGSYQLGVGVVAYFPLDVPGTLLTDMDMWVEIPGVMGKDFLLDAGIPKSRSEFLLAGTAYQPGGEPAAIRFVRAKVGNLEKTLNVIGDRYWVDGVPTDPRPFTEMPLDWAHAFGGPGFAENPAGKGIAPVTVEGHKLHPLPNVELPGSMIDSMKDRPPPAGFGGIDFVAPSRFGRGGTYDKKWLETRFPGFADDMDWRIWNVAPADQWQDEAFRGDEPIVLEHLHPTKQRLTSRLPGIRGRCFVMQSVGGEKRFLDVAVRLTTVWLWPSIERGAVIFHGAHQVAEDDAHDVESIMIAAERIEEAPRPLSHYREVYERRIGEDGVFEALNERDLMPEGMEGLGKGLEEQMELTKMEQLRLKRKTKVAKARVASARAELVAMGLDPDVHGPKEQADPPEIPKFSELAAAAKEYTAQGEKMRSEEGIFREKMDRVRKEICETTGMDLAMLESEVSTAPAGPPTFSAVGERKRLRDLADETFQDTGVRNDELEHYATDEGMFQFFQDTENNFKQAYRMGAHAQGAAPSASPEVSAARRAAIAATHARGESLADVDLTGVDLSGLDLTGADLTRAFLESANLSAATLDRAKLGDAVLTRANLRGTSLVGADLARANLGLADFSGATMRGARITGAILDDVNFTSADLSEADLSESAFVGSVHLENARLTGTLLRSAKFMEVTLDSVSFAGADLTEATFFGVECEAMDFSGAILTDVTFFRTRAPRARFADAQALRFRSIESHFPGADFKRAVMDGATLRGSDLEGADFSGAQLGLADLSEADLSDAILYRIVARKSMWVRTNLRGARMISADLFEAFMEKADIRGTDLRGANLYGADVALVHSDEGTNVQEAIQDKVRFLPLRPPPAPVPPAPGESQ